MLVSANVADAVADAGTVAVKVGGMGLAVWVGVLVAVAVAMLAIAVTALLEVAEGTKAVGEGTLVRAAMEVGVDCRKPKPFSVTASHKPPRTVQAARMARTRPPIISRKARIY